MKGMAMIEGCRGGTRREIKEKTGVM